MSTNKTAIFGLVATLVGTGLGSLAGFNQLMNPANSSDSGVPVATLPNPSPSPTITPSPVVSGWLTQRSSDSQTQSALPIQASPGNESNGGTNDMTADRSFGLDQPLVQNDLERARNPDDMVAAIPDRPWRDTPAMQHDRWQRIHPQPTSSDHGERTLSSLPAPTDPSGRYRCATLTKAEAQALLEQGHTYLDANHDGQACEQGTRGYPTPVPYERPTWQAQETSSQPNPDWPHTRHHR